MLVPARSSTLSQSIQVPPSAQRQVWLRTGTIAVAGTALMALSAHISVALRFTPIPLTMQTFAVLLIGMLFGPGLGAATMLLYLAEGAAGLPVFSPHGLGGLAQLTGSSAGYLLCYPIAALLAGTVFSSNRRLLPRSFAALTAAFLADAVILLAGSAWLSLTLHLSPAHALEVGAVPFLVGETIKVSLVAAAVTALQQIRQSCTL